MRTILNYCKSGIKHLIFILKYFISRMLLIFCIVALFWFVVGKINAWWMFRYDDQDRGAVAIEYDPFDRPVSAASYLEQNWDSSDSLWFYRATQGSNLLPYDFFIALEQQFSQEKFKDASNLNRYRYLPQKRSAGNPDALPIGITKDRYLNKDYIGFTCSACHTSQINYEGKSIRIDGGPAAADMERFLVDMTAALKSTLDSADSTNPEKYERFKTLVLNGNEYKDEQLIYEDLKKYVLALQAYTEINTPWVHKQKESACVDSDVLPSCKAHYGFSRLDAFGRIFNRVIQHSINLDNLMHLLKELDYEVYIEAEEALLALKLEDQSHIVLKALEVIKPYLPSDADSQRNLLNELKLKLYNPANAPVSYPALWDIPQHDYVQWNGMVSNGGIGPLGRNVGQVIGVFGTLDWQRKDGWSFNSVVAGQGFGPTYVDFKSSINKRNLRLVENQLRKLQSPQWPVEFFGENKLKTVKQKQQIQRGEKIYNEYCVSCHTNIERDNPERRVITYMGHIKSLETDPTAAKNSVLLSSYSGLFEGKYVEAGPGHVVFSEKTPIAPMVRYSTQGVVKSWDPDKFWIQRVAEWAYDMAMSIFTNKVKTTLKQGDYDVSTTQDPFAPLLAYKARSLNGIWATAPYLHNGSVPNLYELLLPKKRPEDPELDEGGQAIEYRSDEFMVGSREFDPIRVGFRMSGYDGFLFDTRIPGNSNAGHEYAAGRTKLADGTLLRALSDKERWDLIAYLKTL